MDNSNSTNLDPTIIVIFGVTGDLAKRKILPAIYHLLKDGLLPDKLKIIGTSRTKITLNRLITDLELCVLEQNKVCDSLVLAKFKSILELIQLNPQNPKDFPILNTKLSQIEEANKICFNRLFYLAVPPDVVEDIIKILGLSGLNRSCIHNKAKTRLLIEKPFGNDLNSAKRLISNISHFFKEDQLFRIDHYLAKEMAQNIITFRKYNPIFNQIWDSELIKSVKIKVYENIGIEKRINFYENTGALRDILQSHLLALLTLVTFDIPKNINDINSLHKSKLKLLKKVKLKDSKNIANNLIVGQYKSYRREIKNKNSFTETFVSLSLKIDNLKWNGVNFILVTGKNLKYKKTKIEITFRANKQMAENKLTFRLQPNEGIDLKLNLKKPGLDNQITKTNMDFSYKNSFPSDPGHPDAYERVLIDSLKGDLSLFPTNDEIIESWKIIQPILTSWNKSQTNKNLIIYNDQINPNLIK